MVKWGLYLLVCVYSALDVWQSQLLFSVGAVEINPMFNFLAQYVGLMPAIIGVKVILLSVLGVLLYNYKKEI